MQLYKSIMLKKDALEIFGTAKNIAVALGISKSAVSHIPEDLPQKKSDQMIGAAIRLGLNIPPDVMHRFKLNDQL